MRIHQLATITAIALGSACLAAAQGSSASSAKIPRTADGKPNFEGIWQASTTAGADLQDHAAALNMLAGRSVLLGGGAIPYQPAAAVQRAENYKSRAAADPVNKCFMPGVPRIMYMDYPFQIFETPKAIAMTFEWMLDYRLIYTDGSPHFEDLDFWMGDSRGHWEGDTLVVEVANNNGKTWLDMAGDFHSDKLKVVERYTMTDPNTIEYQATIEDPKVFTKAWTIRLPLQRRTDRTRLFEYVCQAEAEEANGAFARDQHSDKTWYPPSSTPPAAMPINAMPALPERLAKPAGAEIRRNADSKPDIQGLWQSQAGGANQGLEGRRTVVFDPPGGELPLLPWAREEKKSRQDTARGYDDPTAHCFPAGAPRSLWVPSAYEIVQTPDSIVFLHERVAWRIVHMNQTQHLPDNIRLWQGDSIGHWDGDTLVVDTTNFNGKTWLNEGGDILSYAEHLVERFTPTGPNAISYEATISDPVVYSRPWSVAFAIHREKGDLIESACHEEDEDLSHLKALKDAAAAGGSRQ